MNKILLTVFLLVPQLSVCCLHTKYFCEYEYEDIINFSKICDIAYGKSKSAFQPELEEKGWSFQFYEQNSDDPIGVVAKRDNMYVAAYSGTSSMSHLNTDFDFGSVSIVPKLNKFGLFAQMEAHKGFLERYCSLQKMKSNQLIDEIGADQILVFAGHSMGGAMALLSLLDTNLSFSCVEPRPLPLLSLFTIGAPPVLNEMAQGQLSFLHNAYLNIGMVKDHVYNYTVQTSSSKVGSHSYVDNVLVCKPTAIGNCDFSHFGTQVILAGPNDFFEHSLAKYYLPRIKQKPQCVTNIWHDKIISEWDKYWDTSLIHFRNMYNFDDKFYTFQFFDFHHDHEEFQTIDLEGMQSLIRRSKKNEIPDIKGLDTNIRKTTSEGIIFLLQQANNTFPNLLVFDSCFPFTDVEYKSLMSFVTQGENLQKISVDIKLLSVMNQISFYESIRNHHNGKLILAEWGSYKFGNLFFESENDVQSFVKNAASDNRVKGFIKSLEKNSYILHLRDGHYVSGELNEMFEKAIWGIS